MPAVTTRFTILPALTQMAFGFMMILVFSQNGSLKNTVTFLVHGSDAGKFHFDLERQLRVRVYNVLLDLVKSKQIERIKFEGQYLYLSSDKEQSTKQIEQRDQLSLQTGRIPVFISESMVIEILAEVIRQSKRHPRADQVASALAMRGLPIAEKDVMTVFDQYDIEKKNCGFTLIRYLRECIDQLAWRFSAATLFAEIPTARFEPSDCNCVRCQKKLKVLKTHTKTAATLEIGRVRIHEKIKHCDSCHEIYRSAEPRKLVARGCRCGFNVLVDVGPGVVC